MNAPPPDLRPFAEIARGPVAVVAKAYDAQAGRFVLLKTLTPAAAADPLRRARFADEGRLAVRVDHPNVVRVLHAGPDALVTEWVDGTDLAAWLASHGPLPAVLAAYVARELARALGAVHAAAVLHRDVSVANVMLGADGTVRLIDFSLATETADVADEVRGTLGALAPEVVRGEPPGPAADLFGLGVVLVHALTGASPFGRSAPSATLDAVLHADPAADLAADPRVPPPLVAVAATLLDKQPAARGTAAAVEATLSDALGTAADAEKLAAYLADPEAAAPRAWPTPPGDLPTTPEVPRTASDRPPRRARGLVLGVAAVLALAALAWWRTADRGTAGIDAALRPVPSSSRAESTRTVLQTPAPDTLLEAPPDEAAPLAVDDAPAPPDETPDPSLQTPEEPPAPPEAPPVRPRETPPAAAAPGRLVIVAEPWASVRVDGRAMGTTPFGPLTLPAGRHEVAFENPEFPTHTVSVQVESGGEARAAVSLWSLVARVTLDIRPWAEVTVDGESWGTVPPQARPLVLAPGAHVLRFAHPTLGAREVRVQASAGETRTVRVRMDRPDG